MGHDTFPPSSHLRWQNISELEEFSDQNVKLRFLGVLFSLEKASVLLQFKLCHWRIPCEPMKVLDIRAVSKVSSKMHTTQTPTHTLCTGLFVTHLEQLVFFWLHQKLCWGGELCVQHKLHQIPVQAYCLYSKSGQNVVFQNCWTAALSAGLASLG